MIHPLLCVFLHSHRDCFLLHPTMLPETISIQNMSTRLPALPSSRGLGELYTCGRLTTSKKAKICRWLKVMTAYLKAQQAHLTWVGHQKRILQVIGGH